MDLAEARERITTLETELASAQAIQFSGDELCDLYDLAHNAVTEAMDEADKAGTEIIRLADATSSDAFKTAVANNRAFSSRAEYYGNLQDRVKYIYSKKFPGYSL